MVLFFIRFETFTATKCNEVFLGHQPYECGTGIQQSRLSLPSSNQSLIMEAETVSEMLETSSILALLIAHEVFIVCILFSQYHENEVVSKNKSPHAIS
jgi:hypothetical protein